MDSSTRTGIWIIATGVIIALLYFGRAIMAPFALAVFLFLIIEGFARTIAAKIPFIHLRACRLVAIFIVISGFVGFIALMARGIAQFGGDNSADYERRINQLIADGYGVLGMQDAPSLTQLLFNDTGQRLAGTIANEIGELSSDLLLIVIYIAFLFLAQSNWPRKMDRIFIGRERREMSRAVSEAARRGIESYLWTQTAISALITLLTYLSLRVLGVDNALFLSALVFVLNYIPTLGSVVAAVVPPLFALVQPQVPAWVPGIEPQDSYVFAALAFAVVSFWQFSIGNFLQPRMMGESLNLSALVVLLSLAVWGAIWGIPGMFLSAPLTVLVMIFCAQSKSTRWVAVLLSSNGRPRLDYSGDAQDVRSQ